MQVKIVSAGTKWYCKNDIYSENVHNKGVFIIYLEGGL